MLRCAYHNKTYCFHPLIFHCGLLFSEIVHFASNCKTKTIKNAYIWSGQKWISHTILQYIKVNKYVISIHSETNESISWNRT